MPRVPSRNNSCRRSRHCASTTPSGHLRLCRRTSGLHVDGVLGKDTGSSLLDNLQGDGGRRSGHLPSSHR
ncbi:MAG: hypothetical protein HOY76_18770 [Streptomyces sp.]|nr:hypothetical protein [Streptomyces sp.]